jgi:hypothetical protein
VCWRPKPPALRGCLAFCLPSYIELLSPPVSLPKLVSCATSPRATNVERFSRHTRDISYRTMTAVVSLQANNVVTTVTVLPLAVNVAKKYIDPQ